MDLHYCDLCGTIIEGQNLEACRVSDSTICATCRENASAGGGARAKSTDESLSQVMKESNLDLFSSETIAKRKADTSGESRQQSRLTLVDEPPSTGVAASATATAEKEKQSMSATSVGLRSVSPGQSGSFAMHPADEMEGTEVDTKSQSDPSFHESGTAVIHPPANPPRPPAQAQVQRWKIRCVMCEAKLSIKPVERPSRMTCPKCDCKLVIQADESVNVMDGSVAFPRIAMPAPTAPLKKPLNVRPPQEEPQAPPPHAAAPLAAAPPAESERFPAEVVSDLDSMLSAPEAPAAGAPAPAPQVTTREAPPSSDSIPLNIQDPASGIVMSDELSEHPLAPELDPDLDDNLQSLLGNPALPESSADPTPATRAVTPSQQLGAEATVLGVLLCALPVFVALAMTVALENPAASGWLEVLGDSVRESAATIRGWLGFGG